MAMTLTRGDDSRLDGAPSQDLPNYADMVDRIATAMFSQDPAKYGGEVANAREDAIAYIKQEEAKKQAAAAQRRAEGQRAVAQRAEARQARYGVDPEALPYATSARDIQEANRPRQEAEAALEMEQGLAADIIRGSREGQRNWEAEGDLAYLRERGERNPMAGPGQRDLDVRRRLMEQRGQFYEMPDGTRIPVGRDPTAAEMRGLREFEDWSNETPGTERQALYNPAGYEQFREGVRQDIQDRAREDMDYYGTGPDDNGRRARLGLPLLTADQETRRADRAESENRVRQAQRGRFYEDKLMVDAGLAPPPPGPGAGIQELERAAFRGRYARRQAELDRRKQNRIDQAMMAGGQPTGGPFGTRATTTAINQLGPGWREIALLDRLTNGRVGGPTPLGVDALGAQNALRFLNNEALAGMDPVKRAMAQAQLDMQMRTQAPELAGQQDVASGNWQTPEARKHLAGLAERHDTTTGGFSYDDEARLAATLQDPPYNMPQPDAEALAYELAEGRRRLGGTRPEDRNPAPTGPEPDTAPAAPAAPPARAAVPSQPPVTGRPAPPPDAYQWRGNRGLQLPPQSPAMRR